MTTPIDAQAKPRRSETCPAAGGRWAVGGRARHPLSERLRQSLRGLALAGRTIPTKRDKNINIEKHLNFTYLDPA
jgi:hypothetical protein